MSEIPCDFCGGPIPLERERCPHCARPGLFPNVRAALDAAERAALEKRYRSALAAAVARGGETVVGEFEAAVQGSKAVIARPLRELDRLASSDRELLPSYYELLEGGVRLPHGNQWDPLRGLADEALFPSYRRHIHFGALSLDGAGLPSYGEASFVLRDDMIAHRASVYEDNSALSLQKHAYVPPPGHRAAWAERARLCVAKLAGEIGPTTPSSGFPALLQCQGKKPEEDRFVEVHVWGPMTIRTVERATITGPVRRQAFRKAMRDRLKSWNVELEAVP